MLSSHPWLSLACIGLGGGLGAAVRGAGLIFFGGRPIVVHAINVTGCLLAGFALARLQTVGGEAWVRPLVITGFLGGLTTMSAFATGAIGVGNERPLGDNLASALVVVTLCVLAAAMGARVGR
ncbi:MAG: CrcB family protein [Planctomycetota bacterium]|nr:CrcB family protein [Planctomycetota bacterium]